MVELTSVLLVLGFYFVIQARSGRRLIEKYDDETLRGKIDLGSIDKNYPFSARNTKIVRNSVLYHRLLRTIGIVCWGVAGLIAVYLVVS
jgi:hypothetical protein